MKPLEVLPDWDDPEPERCQRCDGEGRVQLPVSGFWALCMTCHGTGRTQ